MKRILLLLVVGTLPLFAGQEVKDPVREAARKRDKQFKEDNYRDLKQASEDLLNLAKELNDEVEKSSQDKISARIFEKLDKIEKLTRRIRDKAHGPY